MNNNPIGIFDSGIGGLTVLSEAIKLLPHEDFIYFGDNKNMPYGDKNSEEVKNFVAEGIKFLAKKKVKAMIVACNTATSVAISDLRSGFDLPLVAMEPAIKPAIEKSGGKKVLVLATPITLREKKFKNLVDRLDAEKELIVIPARGLAEMIENHIVFKSDKFVYSEKIYKYLEEIFSKINFKDISSVVLGCTHYIFLKPYLKKILPANIRVIDGNIGTAKQLKKILEEKNLLGKKNTTGKVEFFCSESDFDAEKIYKNILKNYL